MSNFSKAKKYYTRAEVEQKIKELLGSSELRLTQQNQQIFGLKAQVEKQEKEIKSLKKREKIIKEALIRATEQAKEAYDEAKLRRGQELARLESLAARYEKEIGQCDVTLAKKFQKEMAQLVKDFKVGVGAGELARRRELEKAKKRVEEANNEAIERAKNLEERYKTVLERYQELSEESGKGEVFSIEEALNPTASLEEIMKDIFKK